MISQRKVGILKLDLWWVIALAISLVVLAIFILPDYGMSWDEPTRWKSGDIKLEYYEGFLHAENWREHISRSPRDVYPGLFDLPLAWFSRHCSVDRFTLGHIWSFCFGLSGILATALIARQIVSPSCVWPVGLISGVIILLIPSYFGHLFINPKDIPFAAMYAWAVLGLIRFVREFPRPSVVSSILFGLSVGLAMASRIPGGIVLGYSALLAFGWLLAEVSGKAGKQAVAGDALGLLWRGILAGVIALLVLSPWWPAAHRNPFAAPVEAAEKLHHVSDTIPVLFKGAYYEAGNTPFYYFPWMFVIKMPEWFLLILVAGVCGVCLFLRPGIQLLKRGDSLTWRRLAVILSAAFPLVYVTLAQPAIHNGIRHMLYVLPPLVALAACAVDWLRRCWMLRGKGPMLPLLVVSAVALLGALNLWRLHPYQYIYYNILSGGISDSLGRYETEYWFTSTRHGIQQLSNYIEDHPEENRTPLRVFVTGPWQVAEPFLPDDWELTGDVNQADFIISNTQMMVHSLFEGIEIGRIDRAGLPVLVILKPNR